MTLAFNKNTWLKLILLVVSMLSFEKTLISQTISHGPVLGAMTDTSLKVYIRSTDALQLIVRVSSDAAFVSYTDFIENLDPNKDSTAIVAISGLLPNTYYYYQVLLDQTWVYQNQFRTFPFDGTVDNYVVAFGSCASPSQQDSIFNVIFNHQPDLFLHLGDWSYPDQLYAPANDFFPANDTNILKAFHDKYSDVHMNQLISNVPVDYIYDDHDYMDDNSSSSSASTYSYNVSTQITTLGEDPFPASYRSSVIRGYSDYFPHYPLQDTSQGIYHSLKLGNAEFFMLDLRASRTPNNDAFVQNAGIWSFAPPSNHTILGNVQKSWLENAILNSNADWKFIVSSVTYNRSFSELIDLLMFAQSIPFTYSGNTVTGLYLAAVMGDNWSGFPEDSDWLYDLCVNNNIENVIVLSGDTHTSAIDDGENSGFPELMSANLAHSNSKIAFFIDSIYSRSLFNAGGQGLGNNNYNNAFGKVEIFGADSCRLSIIDQYDQLIASHTVLPFISSINLEEIVRNVKIFPNPMRDLAVISFQTKGDAIIDIIDINGRICRSLKQEGRQKILLERSGLVKGSYIIRVVQDGKITTLPLIVI